MSSHHHELFKGYCLVMTFSCDCTILALSEYVTMYRHTSFYTMVVFPENV
ncbi:hypothetical protein B7P43_G11919 [Cryptotermes secundus]|uniref:Uncharacterized protein n=1 Tax=Cryptotermes secundus TaxID=105785 RepID=A0A2J7Q6Z1_9NEOP|nr:hypothetical protein B7P43_G11919 [Cryptotermes secundus]